MTSLVQRTRIVVAYLLLNLLIAVAIVAAARFVEPRSVAVACTLLAPPLLLLSWRRYLRGLSMDEGRETLTARSILPFIQFHIPFREIERMRVTRASSLDFQGRYNLVVRRKGAWQPLLFEVRTADEHGAVVHWLARAQEILGSRVER